MIGLFYAILASMLWGTNYIVPYLLPNFSTEEILLGRYFAFGCLSLAFNSKIQQLPSLKTVLMVSLFGYFFYDFLDIMNIRTLSPQAVAFLYGSVLLIAPPVINFFINKETPSSGLLMRTTSLLIGLFFLEWGAWQDLADSVMATFIIIVQGAFWIYFTKSIAFNEEEKATSLVLSVGIFCFFISLFGWTCHLAATPISHPPNEWQLFILLSCLSGIGYCWLASYFWNLASKTLDRSFLNMFLLGDVIAGTIYSNFFIYHHFSLIHYFGLLILFFAALPWKKFLLKFSKMY